jgi:hypothetical protein
MTIAKCVKYLPTLLVCVFACPALLAQSSTVDVTTLGARNDGTNAAATTAAFRLAFSKYSTGKIIVPAGYYAIDNSQGSIYIPNFGGELDFQGDAQLIFQSTAHGGLRFEGGSNARIHGMHGNFAVVPTFRGEDEFAFTSMNDLTVEDSIAQNSPGMGFLFTLCIRPKASNITVDTTVADGLAFANSQNAQITGYTARNTIDNALAFYNYANMSDWNGATANDINIYNTASHGVAVVGTSNVVVSGFEVNLTRGSAIWVSEDPVYETRSSYNVVIQHGVLEAIGQIPPAFFTNFGIEFTGSDNVTFSDIQITGSQGRGVSGTAPSGHIIFNNIRVLNNGTGDAFVIGPTALVEMTDCVSINSPNAGFNFDGVTQLTARHLKVINSSSQGGLNRAIWFQNGFSVSASDLAVMDDRPQPAGFIVGAADLGGSIQKGSIQGITSAIANGALAVQNFSPGINVSNAH